MLDLLFRIWKRFNGSLQWRLLWLVNSKYMVSVSGVVQDDAGEVLLQRHRHWIPDVWGLPGGIVRSGERLEDAFAREVLEETGLVISDIKLLRVVSGYNMRLEAYFCSRLKGIGTEQNLRLQAQEVLEARFFPVNALPADMLELQREVILTGVDHGCVYGNSSETSSTEFSR